MNNFLRAVGVLALFILTGACYYKLGDALAAFFIMRY